MSYPESPFTPSLPRPEGKPVIVGGLEYATFTRYWESPAPGIPGKVEVLHNPQKKAVPSSCYRDRLLDLFQNPPLSC